MRRVIPVILGDKSDLLSGSDQSRLGYHWQPMAVSPDGTIKLLPKKICRGTLRLELYSHGRLSISCAGCRLAVPTVQQINGEQNWWDSIPDKTPYYLQLAQWVLAAAKIANGIKQPYSIELQRDYRGATKIACLNTNWHLGYDGGDTLAIGLLAIPSPTLENLGAIAWKELRAVRRKKMA